MVRRAMFGPYWTFTQTTTHVIDHFGFPVAPDDRAAMFAMDNFLGPDALGHRAGLAGRTARHPQEHR